MIECILENGNKTSFRHVTVGVILINDKNQVLLVKRSEKFSRPGKYSIPGGFLDRGENAEEASLRELREEAGYGSREILGLFHVNDDPNRPKEDRQNVDFIYLARAGDGKFLPNDEISLVKWVDKDSLPPEDEFAFDHRKTILKAFEYLDKKFPIPIIGGI